MRDLLELALREGARELQLTSNQIPTMVIRAQIFPIDLPVITSDNVSELLQSIATAEHFSELQRCGDIHFIYVFQHSARFAVTAAIRNGNFEVRLTHLGR